MTACTRDHQTSSGRSRHQSIIALWVACLAIACGSSEERAQLHLERGAAHLDEEAYAAAAIEYRNALQEDPNLADAHYGLAQALTGLGKAQNVIWELRETIRLDPDNLDARLQFGWIALMGGEHAQALEQVEALLARDAEHLEGRLLKAAVLLESGDVARAATESEALLRQHPDEKRAVYNLAQARSRQGRMVDAESHLLRYRALDGGSLAASHELLRFYTSTGQNAKAEAFLREALPESEGEARAELALALADLLEGLERGSEAEDTLREALETAPERLDVRAKLAQLLAREGRLEEGRALLEQAKEVTGATPELWEVLGDLLAEAALLDDALEAYRAGIALAPDSVSLRLRDADVLLRSGDLEGSTGRIRALRAQHPEDADVALAHARNLARAGRSDEAIQALRQLLAREPQNPQAHLELARLWMAKRRPNEALGSLEVAADGLSGEDGRAARRLLAEAHLQIGDLMTAVSLAGQALSEDPGDLQARLVLANALLEGGLPERAEEVLDVAGAPEVAQVYAARARIFARTGRLAQAQTAIERAVALEPDSVQWVLDLSWVLLERGEAEAALRLVRARIAAEPEEPEYPNLEGQILLRREDIAGAERAFRRAAEIDPAFVHSYLNLARMAHRAGRFEDARGLYREALAQRPNDAQVLRELGEFEYYRGRTDAAVDALEASLRADPNSAKTSADLARALADAGRDLSRALELARLARAQNPTDADFAEALGHVLHTSGLHAAAVAQYREAIELAPHPIAAFHYRLGIALADSGEPDEAARALQEALEIDPSFDSAKDARQRLAALESPLQ